ncbi:MAG: hypothetical protein ILO36_00505, partial [Abditibacteriota bacterium]|nr:hypothetical protein [Abditibacteriota bacterium]
MSKPFVFYVIHHSHTDIGYTDYQEKIEAYHIRYIREALDILNAAHSTRPEWLGFKWNCECYWAVERFLAASDERYRDDFYGYVRSGEIGLSASYLNLNDLIDEATLRERMAKNRAATEAQGIRMRSALTCDINGYGWGFADVLYDNGITRLLSDIHTHHGMYPLGRTQTPFWWESPKGSRILAWIGEHYNLGNFWGIDALPSPRSGAPADAAAEEALRQSAEKISGYLEGLLAAGYPYAFAPANVSGTLTDNGFPNAGIAEFCARFNAVHGDEIQLRMATLDEFFDAVEASGIQLPVYSGDWTDWWADGMGSTPGDVRHVREAQRRLNALRNLDPEGKFAGKELMEQSKNDIMMYAEHTWGHSASISRPWEPMSDDLDKRKALYAYRANESVSRALDNYTFSHGETAPSVHKDFLLTVINPHGRQTAAPARFAPERLYGHNDLRIVDAQTGDTVPHQISRGSRGPVITVMASAGPGETKRFRPEDGPAGGDAAKEQPDNAGLPSCIETEFFRIGLDGQQGLAFIYDKQKDAELVSPGAQYPPFTPVYEVTPAGGPDRQCAVRG